MKTEHEIQTEIKRLLSDKRSKSTSTEPLESLIRNALNERRLALQWVLGEAVPAIPEKGGGNGEELTDTSPMPFGKYKGTAMESVPANYLFYLWTNGLKEDKDKSVAKYIRKNLATLQQEYPDGIW